MLEYHIVVFSSSVITLEPLYPCIGKCLEQCQEPTKSTRYFICSLRLHRIDPYIPTPIIIRDGLPMGMDRSKFGLDQSQLQVAHVCQFRRYQTLPVVLHYTSWILILHSYHLHHIFPYLATPQNNFRKKKWSPLLFVCNSRKFRALIYFSCSPPKEGACLLQASSQPYKIFCGSQSLKIDIPL